MSDEQIKVAIRGFLKSMIEGDVPKSLSYLAQDVVWVAPQGTFKGSTEAQKYLTWMKQVAKDYKITENGIGILVQGNIAAIEHNIAATTDNMKWEIPALCVYEFKNEKIQNIRSFYDRLAQASQVVKGVIPKMAVNSVVKATVKGLR
jgi:ketosteroid isomerase-like protein